MDRAIEPSARRARKSRHGVASHCYLINAPPVGPARVKKDSRRAPPNVQVGGGAGSLAREIEEFIRCKEQDRVVGGAPQIIARVIRHVHCRTRRGHVPKSAGVPIGTLGGWAVDPVPARSRASCWGARKGSLTVQAYIPDTPAIGVGGDEPYSEDGRAGARDRRGAR